MNVCLYCCSLYLVRVLIVLIMGRWSEFSACIVCQVVRLLEIVVMSGCCCCMPFSTILVVNPGSPGLESSVLVSS